MRTGVLLILSLLLVQCKTPQPARPEARYDMNPLAVPLSSLHIPVTITHQDLQRIIRQGVTGQSFASPETTKDGLSWSMKVQRDIRVELTGQQIRSVIPIDVHVARSLGFTTLKANGELEVTLHTLFQIRDDWTVQTWTTLEGYDWIRKPVAQVAGLQIPVGALTGLLLDYSRPRLTRAIDDQISKNVDLRALLAPLWTVMRRPIQVSESMNLWFRFEPRVAGIEGFVTDPNGLHSAVHLSGLSRLKAGGPPTLIDPEIDPRFAAAAGNRDSLRLVIHTEIPYDEAERLAENNLIGKTFGEGKRQVTVEGIDLFGQSDHVIASLRLTGAYKGTVHLRGKPVLNNEAHQVELSALDFDVETRNVLHRSASWLFKANIRSTLGKALVFPLGQDMNQVAEEIRRTINTTRPGPWIHLDAGPLDLRLRDILLTPEGMVLDFLLSGRMDIHLKALD